MRYTATTIYAIACTLLVGCGIHQSPQNPISTSQVITRLVIEDEKGIIVKHDVLPGLVRDFAQTKERDGTDIVVAVTPAMRETLKVKINAMLKSTGQRHMTVGRAIRQEQITCHAAFEADGIFAGVGSRCWNALVYRVDPEKPVALMMNREPGNAGMTPEAIRIAAEHEANPGADCVNLNPRVITWERVYALMSAQVVAFENEEGATMVAYCVGRNRLDELPPEVRDQDLEAATRSALIRLRSEAETKDPSGVLLEQYLHQRAQFPDNWLQDEEVLAMLTPLLVEELSRCRVGLRIGDHVLTASGM